MANKAIKKRVARPTANITPEADELYSKIVKSEGFTLLYDFIFGKRKNEIPEFLKAIRNYPSRTKYERESIAVWEDLLKRNILISLKEKSDRFKIKTGKDLKEEIDKAILGNDTSLFEVISFDKIYLS